MSIEYSGFVGEAWCTECGRVFGTGEYQKAMNHECNNE